MFAQFFGFSGRVGRGTWWLGYFYNLMISVIFRALMASSLAEFTAAAKAGKPDPHVVLAALAQLGGQSLILLPFSLAGIWISLSTSIQRLHDRNSSGFRLLFAYAPIVLLGFSIYLLGIKAFGAGIVALLLSLAGFVLAAVWSIVEFGCMSGDDSYNEYGPPPGSASRRADLENEIAGLAGGGAMSKLDDNYMADYARNIAIQRAEQQNSDRAPQPAFGGAARPVFGKR